MTDETPPGADALPQSLVELMEELCDRFEADWRAGRPPRIEECLAEMPEPGRLALLRELLGLELVLRRNAGERVEVQEYRTRFPDHPGPVEAIFADEGLRETLTYLRTTRTLGLGPRSEGIHEIAPGYGLGASALHIFCPHCQNAIEVVDLRSTEEVLCPSCGSSFRLHQDATGSWCPKAGHRTLGHFELIESVGAGAFGTVYRARDTRLGRTVAIKVPRAGTFGSAEERDRFLREARSVAQLRHHAIVPVHEVGEHEGLSYLVSDFVHGRTLADLMTSSRPTFREAAKLLSQIADALHYAHERGVVHRDVKPSNIMLDGEDRPHLMDFGLAKRDAGEVTITVDGQVLGTPAYMSPEQARGEANKVDGRSDVYSLGVILYQLLTGELPFRGNVRMLLHQVLNDEARPPRKLNDRIPRDLETICLKCLEKSPDRRFQTAEELADELRRWLNREPIRSRPVGPPGRLLRWSMRHPAIAGLAGAIVAVTLIGFAGVTWQWQRARLAAKLAQNRGELADRRATQVRGALAVAQTQRTLAEQRERVARGNLYSAQMNLAMRAWEAGNAQLVLQLLANQVPRPGQEDLRQFDWYYLWRLCNDEGVKVLHCNQGGISRVAYSPDGATLATAAGDQAVKLWDVATARVRRTLVGNEGQVLNVAFSPDGRLVATAGGDQAARLWDAETGEELRSFKGHATIIAFSPDGATLATGGNVGEIKFWDVDSGREKSSFPAPKDMLTLRYSPDGRMLAAAGGSYFMPGLVVLWDAEKGREIRRFKGHTDVLAGLAFTSDGRTLITGGNDGMIMVWDVDTGQLRKTIGGQSVQVLNIALAADDTTLAAAYWDSSIKLWNLATGQHLATLAGHTGNAADVKFAPDGHHLASCSADGTARLWDTATIGPTLLKGHEGEVRRVAFSPEGRLVATGSFDRSVRLWDSATGEEKANLSGHEGFVEDVRFSPDGALLASAGGDQTVRLWDLASRRSKVISVGRQIMSISFSPDSRLLAIAMGSPFETVAGAIILWDVNESRVRRILRGHPLPVSAVAFSPDGSKLASAGNDVTVKLWDVASGSELLTLRGHMDSITYELFSPDGKILVSASRDRTAKLWDVASGRLLSTLAGHGAWIYQAAFTPSGKMLATADWDGNVKFWNMETFQECATLDAHRRPIWSLAFSPDGTTLATASADRTVKLWRAATERTARDWSDQVLIDEWRDLARAHTLAGRYPEADSDYAKAIALQGRLATRASDGRQARQFLATLQVELSRLLATCPDPKYSDPARAVAQAEQATRNWPESFDSWRTLGVALFCADRWGPSIAGFEKSMSLHSGGDGFDWFFLAMDYWQQGRKDEALKWYEKAVKWMVDSNVSDENLIQLRGKAGALLGVP